MNRTARRHTPATARRPVAVAASLGIAGLLLASPAGAATPSVVARDVARALQLAAPTIATLDDRTTPGTGCMTGPTAQPLAYRNDRVVLRTTRTDGRAVVQAALNAIPGNGTAGPPEVIQLPQTPPGPRPSARVVDLAPIVVVPVRSADGHVDILRLARRIVSSTGIPAAPDYFLSPTGPVGMWPSGNPKGTGSLEAPRPDGTLGHDTEVWVADTGLPDDTRAWAPKVERFSAADVERPDVVQPALDVVDLYFAGHTLAISGVLEVMAPAARVRAVRITEAGGVATDVSAARRLASTLRSTAAWPDVVVASFGSPACDGPSPGTELVPLGLQAVAQAVTARGGTVITAAAGNRSSQRRFYPAAFDESAATSAVLGIGALAATTDGDGNAWTSASRSAMPATFSNAGPWVRAWAPGAGLATRHVFGLRFPGDPRLQGKAVVDGTSFAAPYVAGLILSELTSSPGKADAVQARNAVLGSGRVCKGSGHGIALALTAKDAASDTRSTLPVEC